MKRYDGVFRWHLFKATPQHLPNGEFMGYVGISIDIHLQKTALEELESKNHELVRSNNELDNFIYTASHDLKSPISNLEGLMNEYFSDVDSSDEQQAIINMMFHSIERFKTTIKDLTEISKVQQGEQDLETLFFDEMLDEIKLDIRELLMRFTPNVETDFAINTIKYSRKDLRSIMYNLISNALKYSSPDRLPEVKISTTEQNNFTVLKVADNGLGLSKDNQSKLFGMFTRVHQHIEGSGIGLYMIKKMIENAGGKIEIESEVGRGTTFIVYLTSNHSI